MRDKIYLVLLGIGYGVVMGCVLMLAGIQRRCEEDGEFTGISGHTKIYHCYRHRSHR